MDIQDKVADIDQHASTVLKDYVSIGMLGITIRQDGDNALVICPLGCEEEILDILDAAREMLVNRSRIKGYAKAASRIN